MEGRDAEGPEACTSAGEAGPSISASKASIHKDSTATLNGGLIPRVWEEGRDPLTPYVIFRDTKYAVEPGKRMREYAPWRAGEMCLMVDCDRKVHHCPGFYAHEGYKIVESPEPETVDPWAYVTWAIQSAFGTQASVVAERDASEAGPCVSEGAAGPSTSASGATSDQDLAAALKEGEEARVWEEGWDPATPYVIYRDTKYAVEPGKRMRDYELWRAGDLCLMVDCDRKVYHTNNEFRSDEGYKIVEIVREESASIWICVVSPMQTLLRSVAATVHTLTTSGNKKCD